MGYQIVQTQTGHCVRVKVEELEYWTPQEETLEVAFAPPLPPVPPPPQPLPPPMPPAMARETAKGVKRALRVALEAAQTIASTRGQKIAVEVRLVPMSE